MTTKEIETMINKIDYFDTILNIIESSHTFVCELDKIEDADYVYQIYTKLTNIVDNQIDNLLGLAGIYSDNEDAFHSFWLAWNNKKQVSKELIYDEIMRGVLLCIDSIEDE